MNTKAIFTIVGIVAALAATSLIPIHQVVFADPSKPNPNANPNAPGQTGLNPGQSDGNSGPPGQTGCNNPPPGERCF